MSHPPPLPRILLVEDEPGLVLTLTDLLEAEGYAVTSRTDGESGLAAALAEPFEIVILDVMLPRLQGFDVLKELRRQGNASAVLMLTARGLTLDKVVGLKLGADDYLAKPFDPAELLARLEALRRRLLRAPATTLHFFSFANIEVNFDRALLHKNGQTIPLATKELLLLRYLIEHRGRIIPREELLEKVWDYQSDVNSRTLDVHISWLRQKIEDVPQTPAYIHTIRGKGYRFAA
ncbi:MAG: response regulator transcription factor [Bryobacter sp.]